MMLRRLSSLRAGLETMQNSYPLVELSSSALTLTTPAISAGASVLAELNPLIESIDPEASNAWDLEREITFLLYPSI